MIQNSKFKMSESETLSTENENEIFPFIQLTPSLQKRIFQSLNLTDLKNVRLVSALFNTLISTSTFFLNSSSFLLTFHAENRKTIQNSIVRWENVKISCIYEAEEEAIEPPFSSYVKNCEFEHCFISWTQFKKMCNFFNLIESLNINHSVFHESPNEGEKSYELGIFRAGLRDLRHLELSENGDLGNLISLSEKFHNFGTCKRLNSLKITFVPICGENGNPLALRFLQTLVELINQNFTTLKKLVLDISTPAILNYFPSIFFPQIDPGLKLNFFHLGKDGRVDCETGQFLFSLAEFISVQKELVSLAVPNIEGLGAFEGRRGQLIDSAPRGLKELWVPSPSYLKRNFFKAFHSLRKLCIGDGGGGGHANVLQPTKFLYDRGGIAKRHCKKIQEIEIRSRTNYEPGMLYHILEKVPNLSTFNFNPLKPILNDRDIQALIKQCPKLKSLILSHCDFISDIGIGGTINSENETIGRPISDLFGLVTLKLIGRSNLSDAGLYLGLKFQNLRTLHLPWSSRITEWGVEKVCRQNSCLENLVLTRGREGIMLGAVRAISEHKRLNKSNVKIQNLGEVEDEVEPTLTSGILYGRMKTNY